MNLCEIKTACKAKKELEREGTFIFIHSLVYCFISTLWQALDLGIDAENSIVE